jgi:RNA polymerase sigma factor (sigma-70 family)
MEHQETRTDGELLAATPGDPDAFAVFYRRHVKAVLGFVARRAQPADVGDLVAEVFATALVHRRRYDSERGSAGAWLTGIATNQLADARRRGAVEAQLCRRLGMVRPTLAAATIESELGARAMLQELPDEQRRAVAARVFFDQPYQEIARAHAVSTEVARKRVSRALSTLRSRLQQEDQ